MRPKECAGIGLGPESAQGSWIQAGLLSFDFVFPFQLKGFSRVMANQICTFKILQYAED